MQIKSSENLTDKKILITLLVLSYPIIIGDVMHLMYNLADTFWVGRLGAEYLAAISLSFPLIFLIFSFAGGFSVAGMTLISQYIGAENQKMANLAAGQVLVLSVVISVFFSGVGLILGEELLQVMGAEAEVLKSAWEYFRIIMWGIPLVFVYFVFSSALQGIGDTKTPMKLKLITVLINIILDPFLIFGWFLFPKLGIKGAAIATIFSRFIGAIIGMYLFFTGKKGIKLKLDYLKPDKEMVKQIIKVGFPAAIGMSALSLAMAVMTSIVTAFGTYTLAAWGITNRITSLIRMPAQGVGRATGVLIGQFLGADKPDEAGITAWLGVGITFGFQILVATLILFVAPYLIMLFTENLNVIEIGSYYLKIAGFAFAFLGVQQVLSESLKGAGNTVEQMLFRILTLWILQIPLSLFMAYTLGLSQKGVWWAILLAKFLGALVVIFWFIKGTWKTKIID
ncbi:MATE family efflux transporter [Natroniella acetigena]|uniref:MATE family efflux transporter n=1 Tax=Natroniella acetigena TaxID=52004 RepID=UPI00200A1CD2|nr:MATE family efflux transporter [Natroniella acetigena]MCK8828515.1 MATE family efflux transporter [Natroniella acetigena]